MKNDKVFVLALLTSVVSSGDLKTLGRQQRARALYVASQLQNKEARQINREHILVQEPQEKTELESTARFLEDMPLAADAIDDAVEILDSNDDALEQEEESTAETEVDFDDIVSQETNALLEEHDLIMRRAQALVVDSNLALKASEQSVKPGQTVTLTATSGFQDNYQWFINGNLTDASTTRTLTHKPVTNPTYYFVLVEDQHGNKVESDLIAVDVADQPIVGPASTASNALTASRASDDTVFQSLPVNELETGVEAPKRAPSNIVASDPTRLLLSQKRVVGDAGICMQFSVKNSGSVAASQFVVTEKLPCCLSFVQGSGTDWTIAAAGDQVIATYDGLLQAGATASCKVTLKTNGCCPAKTKVETHASLTSTQIPSALAANCQIKIK